MVSKNRIFLCVLFFNFKTYVIYYRIVTDNGDNHIVTLFPPKCSCKMPNCCHILAVQTKMGKQLCIYKPNTFSSMINIERSFSQQKSLSGSKKLYQTRNSNPTTTKVIIENENIHVPFLIEIIKDQINADDLLNIDSIKFSINQIKTNAESLTEIFLNNDSHEFLKKYFEEDAWISVSNLIECCINLFKCEFCKSECKHDFLTCTNCKKYYHYGCQQVSNYFKKNFQKWKCSGCKKLKN